jgi:hypothetical protein
MGKIGLRIGGDLNRIVAIHAGENVRKFYWHDVEGLDRVVYDLLREISSTADLRNCFVEADVREIGSERQW